MVVVAVDRWDKPPVFQLFSGGLDSSGCHYLPWIRPPAGPGLWSKGWVAWGLSAAAVSRVDHPPASWLWSRVEVAGFLVMEQGLRFLTRSPFGLPLFGPLAVERRSFFPLCLCLSVVLGCSLLQCPVQGYMRDIKQNKQTKTNQPSPPPPARKLITLLFLKS